MICFGLVLWHINYFGLFDARFYLYAYIRYAWFGLVLWHINHCRLLDAKSGLFIYIISYDLVGWVSWHINHCRLLNIKYSLYVYVRYKLLDLVWFYGISTILGYLMPNPVYTYILNIYDLETCQQRK